MKHLPLFGMLGLAVSGLCSCSSSSSLDAPQPSSVSSLKKYPTMVVRTTAYTHSESDHIAYGNKTAIGTPLRYHSKIRSAAADWSRFPLGTRFQIMGSPVVYEVDDYGSALVGKNTLDLYKPSKEHMNAWGARYVRIRILRWGSYRKSLEIMQPRMQYPHVREMVYAIQRKRGQRVS
jgi:3D (Asp-Asp-Asp) domain-containing protein